jgi:hypothetical protein
MRFRIAFAIGCSLVAGLIWTNTGAGAQRSGMFQGSAEDPGIKYMSNPLENPIDSLNKRLEAGL